jgi:ATP-binding cassette subfamily B (MDR/TAP) protein 1
LKDDSKSNDEKKNPSLKPVGFLSLFRFAKKQDKVIIVFAAIFSCLQGALLPAMTLIFANFTDNFGSDMDKQKMKDQMIKQAFQMLYLGAAIFGFSSIALILWTIAGQRQMRNLRSEYFHNIILKNSSWFDKEKPGKLANAYYEHLSTFVKVYGNKLHILFQVIMMTIFGFAVGFYKGWLMSLIILAISPLMAVGMIILMYFVGKADQLEKDAYSEAGSLSDQTFEYIRTVKSLNGQEHEISKYSNSLSGVLKSNRRFTWKIALSYALFYFSMSGLYALCFYVGNLFLNKEWKNDNTGKIYTVGDYLGIFFAILTGVSGMGVIAPIQRSVAEAKIAMARINQIVNNDNIDSSGTMIPEMDDIKGEIQFENVSFAYPSAPDKMVLKNISFTVQPGQKFAIVGPSGSGKSTIIQLLERYYDPNEGRILLDGVDIKTISLKKYRKMLGLVSQQPILFADTILNNLKIGIEEENISEEKIWESLEQANIKKFIKEKLEDGLETYVGNQGGKLSGGQKQRISIARTLLRNPKIFLFDEATSALDRQNEKQIQETIDNVCTDVTSLSIAHRLQTIKNSGEIIVLVDGEIVENGTHDELMKIENGVYQDLYSKQDKGEDVSKEENEKEVSLDETIDKDEEKDNSEDDLISDSKKKLETKESIKDKEKEDKKKSFNLISMSNYLSCCDVILLILGVLASGAVGVNMPFTGYYFGKMLGVLGKYTILHEKDIGPLPFNADTLWTEGMKYVYVLLSIAGATFIFAFFQLWFFAFVSEKFIIRIRKVLYRKFIYKDMEFFDQPTNKPGNLSAKLAEDCRIIRSLVAQYLGSILQSIASFGVGLGFGIWKSWRISVLVICLSPFLFLSGILESVIYFGSGTDKLKEDENLVQETFNNIKVK